MNKYTPSPWKIVEREVMEEDCSVYPQHIVGGESELLVVYLESSTVADIAIKKPGTFWDTSPTKEANACLIAAAPELLEALLKVLAVTDRRTDEFDYAWAVVAKARGENNNE